MLSSVSKVAWTELLFVLFSENHFGFMRMVHQCFQITLKLNTLREWAALTGQTLEVSSGLTGHEIAPNTVANATKIIVLATKV